MSSDVSERFVAVRPVTVGGPGPRPIGRLSTAVSGAAELPGLGELPELRERPELREPAELPEPAAPLGRTLPEFGSLASLVADAAVTDVFVNGLGETWVDRGSGLERRESLPFDEEGVRNLAVRLIALGGRHIDESTPCIDVRLRDGIRVHAVLPPISPRGTLLSIRLPRVRRLGIDDLAASGFFDTVPVEPILALIASRANILVTGAGGSGKTTLLSALLAAAPPTDRIIAIEDVAELQVDHQHFVSLEARQSNLEGVGEIDLARLVREALRMRPDRLVLGECRGGEVRELLAALNTGHDGGAGTLHANSLEDVPARLEALGALAGLGVTAIARQAVSAIDAVLHLEQANGVRHLAALGRLRVDQKGRLATSPMEHAVADDGAPDDVAPVDAAPVDAVPVDAVPDK